MFHLVPAAGESSPHQGPHFWPKQICNTHIFLFSQRFLDILFIIRDKVLYLFQYIFFKSLTNKLLWKVQSQEVKLWTFSVTLGWTEPTFWSYNIHVWLTLVTKTPTLNDLCLQIKRINRLFVLPPSQEVPHECPCVCLWGNSLTSSIRAQAPALILIQCFSPQFSRFVSLRQGICF